MKKLITSLLAGSLMAATAISIAATPSVEEVKADIAEFQGYFLKKFPSVSLEDYQDGVNSLPQYADRRANWEMLMDFPPYEEFVDMANEEWAAALPSGKTLQSCFSDSPAGNEYPYVDGSGKLHTIENDINQCIVDNGGEKEKYSGQKMARLVIAFKSQANGRPLTVDYSSDEMREWYAKGREFFWAKRGQLNFSCADCHVTNAGNKVRGDVLSSALGHGTGFPVYRTKWGANGGKKPLGTVHRRYKGCNKQVRAANFKDGSDEYLGLEVYEAIMSSGVPLQVPSQRQ
jgi:sulfur-oxidizing protein SoxA